MKNARRSRTETCSPSATRNSRRPVRLACTIDTVLPGGSPASDLYSCRQHRRTRPSPNCGCDLTLPRILKFAWARPIKLGGSTPSFCSASLIPKEDEKLSHACTAVTCLQIIHLYGCYMYVGLHKCVLHVCMYAYRAQMCNT